jgi:hypothetical protein
VGRRLDANADEKGGHDKEANSLAQVRHGNLVDSEEWEANYHNQKAQLNKQRVRDRHVWGKKLDSDAKRSLGAARRQQDTSWKAQNRLEGGTIRRGRLTHLPKSALATS